MNTRVLLVANFLAFVWELVAGGPSIISAFGGNAVQVAYERGGLIPVRVLIDHEYWRIVTSAFLHAGLIHLGVNMVSLWSLGRFIEYAAGPVRMAVIYAVSLLASGLAVTFLSPPDAGTIGASGAIFGLFGALFAVGIKLGRDGMQLVRGNIGLLVINLIFTFSVPGISWQGHTGGLIAGFLLTLAIYYPPRKIAPAVVDATTGQGYETEYQPPPQA